MNYHKYISVDVINGPGTRCTLFVSGCEHKCPGCYNAKTWQAESGHLFDQSLQDRILADLSDNRIKRRGLSLSGGDPMHPANLDALIALCSKVKRQLPDKDIWCWTGYELNQLNSKQQELLALVDVLIDGRFEQDLANPKLLWRGSSNQQIHQLTQPISTQSVSSQQVLSNLYSGERKCA
ncbi:anaerobic ribonucleoside-triphosphate reductase-activating protein [Pelagibaculum spongiae]|uniref:Anaerobic ribonucleoside-triphosphate reductase-activating protein n=1 Tax=Pelagibaculum spongiae TaxID=2080658 RepID=A0A2V1GXP4_9GAMM|nr:anaerobic ribonucleoside-triphosphate reductase-activating protein [Pelagibaculum spongiae]PVZ66282.1 anaerobic ribonucleotide reductase-activating protein [Pelagibaculum spongiae]